MESLERRLEYLEARGAKSRVAEEERVSRQALRRVTDGDLHLLHAYLKRTKKEGGEPTDEEEAALCRYAEIKEEVRIERAQTA